MKKSIFSILCILLAFCQLGAQNIRVATNDMQQVTLKVATSPLQVSDIATDHGIYSKVTMDNFLQTTEPGMPELPVYTQMIEIPLCGEIHVSATAGRVKSYAGSTLGINHPVYPAQKAYHKSYTGEREFVQNEDVYTANAFYGNELAKVEKNGIMRCINLATVYIYPVQYNPVTNEVRIYEDITVTVTYDDVDMAATREMKRKHGNAQFSAPAEVINPMQIERDAITNAPIKYQIIANSMFQGQLDEFANWKRRKGFIVDIAYTSTIGTTTTAIKNYLQGLYDNATAANPAPTYVLFVGDVAQVPSYSVTTLDSHVTDLYYCLWTGGDYLPECYYGRFSAQSIAQLTPQIEKTLMYEQYTMPDPSYLDKALLIGGEDGGSSGDYGYSHADPAIHYIEDTYVNSTYGYSEVHSFYNPHSNSTSTQVRSYLNQGMGWANYTAHCSSTGWYKPSMQTSNISSMNNAGKYGIMIGNCCQSNMFNESECFGEALLRTANKGAVGYIGGTDYTYWYEDYYWAVGVRSLQGSCSNCNLTTYNASNLGAYDRAFHTHGETYPDWYVSTGAMIKAGNMAVQASSSGSTYKQYYWEIYALMGDPSVMPWLTQASNMHITIDGIATQNNTHTADDGTTSFTVSTGAPYSYIALTQNLNFIAAVLSDANGNAVITFPALNAGETYELAASAQNYKTTFTTITVENSNSPRIALQSYTPQTIIHGEATNLTLTMVNMGGVPTTGSTAVTLTCNDPLLTINDATESYPAMTEQGGTATVANGFLVTADNSVETGHVFTINWTATYGTDSWSGAFTLNALGSDCDAPTGLVASLDGEDVILTWPSNSSMETITLTDDAEGHPSFEVNSPGTLGWSYIDGDDTNTGGFNGFDFPAESGKIAYIVMDNSGISSLSTHSGSKFFASVWTSGTANNDWMITPELNFTSPFTFSFYARSASGNYSNERFYVAYSTTGTNASDFTNITSNYVTTNTTWRQYSYTIPAEAKYVAIHCVSNDQYMFCVDDIVISGEAVVGTPVNIYRDGVLIASNVYGDTYTDAGLANGTYCYTITSFCGDNMETAHSEASCITLNGETPSYTITVNPDDAAHGTTTGSGVYEAGTHVTIEAIPAAHYTFTRWNDNSTVNPRTITVTGSATYTAYFDAEQFTITAVADNATHGTVTGGGTYDYGTVITLVATPATGYEFTGWSDSNTDNPRTLTVTENASFTANFSIASYTITAVPNDAALGTVSGGGTYSYGTQVTLTATANEGYQFRRWDDNNTANPRIITVTGNASYTAIFNEEDTANLVDVTHSVSIISGNGDADINAGETIRIAVSSRNDGLGISGEVTSTLSTTSPYATIPAPVQTFASVGSAATIWSQFDINIDPNTPDNTPITFTHRIAETNRPTNFDTYTVTITVLPLHVAQPSLVDVSRYINIISGNGDNDVNAGEIVRISIVSENEGDGNATAVISSLSTTSSYASIASPVVSLGDIAAGGTANSQFDVLFSETTPHATEIPFVHTLAYNGQSYSDNFTVLVLNNVGISENGATAISVYPNPATDYVTIGLNSVKATEAAVYNVFGQRVATASLQGSTQISMKGLASGVYFVKLINEGEVIATAKVIKK